MIANTDAQRELHADLVSKDAQTLIDVARTGGALGWKINGAGGEGGSVTLLCGPGDELKLQLLSAVRESNPLFRIIPTHLSRHGLRVWQT
jgi:D-glycero-alpha-D-manno-heptose-7-phosphate kinase